MLITLEDQKQPEWPTENTVACTMIDLICTLIITVATVKNVHYVCTYENHYCMTGLFPQVFSSITDVPLKFRTTYLNILVNLNS